jgi:hypothetical protein
MSRMLFSCIGLGLLLMAGCGAGKPASASVTGKVTAGGQPVTGAMINFMNPKSGAAASGDLDASGAYSIAAGLPPGSYKVSVIPKSTMDQAPKTGQEAKKAAPASSVPLKFRSDATSGLTAEIKPGANPNVDFKLD